MTIFDGKKALWMWEFSAQAEKTLADACQTAKTLAGCDLLLVKAMDGSDWMNLYDPGGYAGLSQFQADAAAAAGMGVTVIPWVVPHGQAPQAEAAVHAKLGPTLLVDVEPYQGFWTGPAANLPAYLQALRAGGVKELHISIDPRPSALAALGGPGSWAGSVDGVHPQVYWTDFGQPALSVLPLIQNLIQGTGTSGQGPGGAGPVPSVFPVLPGNGSATDLADVWTAAQQLGCRGLSAWRLGSMDTAQLAAFANLAAPAAPTPQPPPSTLDEQIAALSAKLDALSAGLARLNTVLTKRFLLMRDALDPDNPPA